MNPLIVGAAAGLIGDKAGDQIDKLQGKPEHPLLGSSLHQDIHHAVELLEKIAKGVEHSAERSYLTIPLNNYVTLHTKSRPYNSMFLGASTSVVFSIAGIGDVPLTLTPGWNMLNMPDGTRVSLPSAATAAVNVLFFTSNNSFGNAI